MDDVPSTAPAAEPHLDDRGPLGAPRLTSFRHQGLTFDVTDSGPADGRVVLALHGFPEDRHSWDPLAERLGPEGYRVLAPDQRGYSPGARPARRVDYRLAHLVADALALVDAAGVAQVDVVGHDWGAVVAWGLAGRVPDRVRTLTALSVPHPRAFAAALARSGQLLHSWYMAAFQLPALPERALAARRGQLLGHLLRRDGLDAASAARIAARAADPAAMRGPIGWYRALGRSVRALPGSVAVPTLMVWGDRDHYVSRAAVSGAARYVVGPYRLEVLIGASHWLPTTAVDRLAPLVLDHLRAH